MKVGLIRCMQTEDICPATTDLKMMREKSGVFAEFDEEIELIGINSCGGCPGKKAVARAKEMVRRGADTIVFASCILRGTPNGFACPFARQMQKYVREAIGEEIRIIEYTH